MPPALVRIEESHEDRAIHRWIDRGLFALANQQRAMEKPPALALLSVRGALANLCGLLLRREIDDADFLIDRISVGAHRDHRWSKYLVSYSESVRHPVQDLQGGQALHPWIDNLIQAGGPVASPSEYVRMDSGHWVERALIARYATKTQGACPTRDRARTVVGLRPTQ